MIATDTPAVPGDERKYRTKKNNRRNDANHGYDSTTETQ